MGQRTGIIPCAVASLCWLEQGRPRAQVTSEVNREGFGRVGMESMGLSDGPQWGPGKAEQPDRGGQGGWEGWVQAPKQSSANMS